ncbi:MAG TPA: copper resistance CopC family protein [Gemmatimonadaceae bacterium]|nr:copper resistance CopC family protein [Gemmatimonadaceae bacterium]
MLTSHARRLSALADLAAIVASLTAWRTPFFHLHLLKSVPEANATVPAAPDSIRLWFSQVPELKLTTIKVTGPGNAAVPLTPLASRDSTALVVGVKAKMSSGAYTVRWRTMARDGHVAGGSFAFTVAPVRR